MNYFVATIAAAAVLASSCLSANAPTKENFEVPEGRGSEYEALASIEIDRISRIVSRVFITSKNISDAERIYWIDKIAGSDFGALMLTITPQRIYQTAKFDTNSREASYAVIEIWSRVPENSWKSSFDYSTLGELPGERKRLSELLETEESQLQLIPEETKRRTLLNDEQNLAFGGELNFRNDPESHQGYYEKTVMSLARRLASTATDDELDRLIDIDSKSIESKRGRILDAIQMGLAKKPEPRS